jgi:hypothetical protein
MQRIQAVPEHPIGVRIEVAIAIKGLEPPSAGSPQRRRRREAEYSTLVIWRVILVSSVGRGDFGTSAPTVGDRPKDAAVTAVWRMARQRSIDRGVVAHQHPTGVIALQNRDGSLAYTASC